jgi:lysophospholipase L1-like esterase
MNARKESHALAAEAENAKPARRRERRAKLLLMFGSILLGLAIVEVGLRIVGYSYPQFYVPDEHRGYALRPGMEGWYRKEGEAYVRINSDGLRDREHAKAKPANALRIAVLGDSYTEAFQVAFEDSFCAVLERKLRECPGLAGRDVEVINFGVSGYGTAQELITLRNNVWQYAPDVVLLTVTTSNDISENVRALKKADEIPYFVWRDGKLVEDDSFLQTRTFRLRNSALNRFGCWFRDRLRVIQAINQAHHVIKAYLTTRRSMNTEANQSQRPRLSASQNQSQNRANQTQDGVAAAEELGVDNVVYREPGDAIWKDAWRTTEGLIAMMRDEVQSKGAKFFVLTLSNGIQVWPYHEGRDAFLQRIGARDIFYPDNRIREFCERQRIPVACLAPAMQRYVEEKRVFLHGLGKNIGSGHWNVLGNRVAGELAAAELCKQLQNPD